MEYKIIYSVENIEPEFDAAIALVGLFLVIVHFIIKRFRFKTIEEAGIEFLFRKELRHLLTGEIIRPFLLVLGVTLMVGALGWYFLTQGKIQKYINRLNSEHTKVVEGNVKVLSTQPYDGHAKGDIIKIGNVKFKIDYYLMTGYYYNTTISHGGVLTAGKNIRVHYLPISENSDLPYTGDNESRYEWKILKIEYGYGR